MSPALPLPLLLDLALRGGLVALLLLLAAMLWRDGPGTASARTGAALALGLGCYAVTGAPGFDAAVPAVARAPWMAVANGNSVLFWLFAAALFDDDFELRPVHALPWAAMALLGGLQCAWWGPQASPEAPFVVAVLHWAPLGFAAMALAAAARHWRDDLVEQRRRVRLFIVAAGSLYTVVMLAVRVASPSGRLAAGTATLDIAALLAIVAGVVWHWLQLARTDLLPLAEAAGAPPAAAVVERPPPAADTGDEPGVPASVEAAPSARTTTPTRAATPSAAADPRAVTRPDTSPDPADERLLAQLATLMGTERAYRDEPLTLATLAARLDAPEYRLRRVIHQRLGHRHFSAYVNSHRLAEVRAALADPARRELPVLTLALEAGFQSIGPFNRAFKADTGLTPTEFRRQQLADSCNRPAA